MKSTWLLLAVLAVALPQAGAQQADTDALARASETNRAAALGSGRISPRQRAELERASLADENSEAGARLLAGNKARPWVTTLPSGVEYRIIKTGSGKRPGEGSTVLCRYTGTLTDGSVFDRSDEHQPTPLKLAGVVPGLREALKLMPLGSRWEVLVPPQLGYGVRGSEGVGPNAMLTYVVELVGIQ